MQASIAMFRRALGVQPTSIQAWHDPAVALEAAARTDEARQARARARALYEAGQ